MGLENVGDADHVMLRDTLSNAHNKRNLGGNGLLNTGSGNWGRDEDGRGSSSSLLHSIGNILEDGLAKVSLSGLLGVGTTNDIGAVLNGLGSVEGSLLSGEALVDNLGLVVDTEVSNGCGVWGGGSRVLAARGSAQSRGQGLSEALHFESKRENRDKGEG